MEAIIMQDLVKEANQLGKKMVADIIKRHKAAGQYTTGKTSGMLHIVPTENGFQLVGWTYTGTYEEGRRPNRAKWGTSGNQSTEFSDSLIAWAQAKGITFRTPRDAQSWAYCVMRKIATEGTRRYKKAMQGQPEDILRTPIREMQEALQAKVSGYFAEEIKRQLLRIDLQEK